jgi:hypothetical protein
MGTKIPLFSVYAMRRSGSNHTPLFIDSGEPAHIGNNFFSFELSWMHRDGFTKLVTNEWNAIQLKILLSKEAK